MELKDVLQQHTDAVEQQVGALGEDVKKALEEVGFVKSIASDLEQKFSRLPTDLSGDARVRTPGQQFVEPTRSRASSATHRLAGACLSKRRRSRPPATAAALCSLRSAT